MRLAKLRWAVRAGAAVWAVTCVLSVAKAEVAAPAKTRAALHKIYSFDLDGAIADARQMQQEEPRHPAGYLLEGEALWWRIWCESADFKYGLNDVRRRAKLPGDQAYFEIAAKATKLAEEDLRAHETASMHLYAAMGEALTARLYGIRGENRNTARFGVRAREHFQRALALDPQMTDAEFGLGLYNYYVDTLNAMAKVLRFFMGIPGGDKQQGIAQLKRVMERGELTGEAARFYLAMNLCKYDRQYEQSLALITPLAEQFPENPIFHLVRGDFLAKLNRKELAAASYRRALAAASSGDSACRGNLQSLVQQSLVPPGQPKE